MSIASMDTFSSISDLEYTDSELSSGTISLGELCIAEKKQMVLRDAPFRVGSAEKVGSWLDKLYMARTLLLAPEVQNKRVDEGISVLNVHGGAKQGLPSSPDEMDCCSIQQLDMAGRPNGITTSKNDAPLAFADRRDSGRSDVLPAVQLDPHSALRAARRLITACHNPISRRHVDLPVPHVWARRLALTLEGEDTSAEALAMFAALTRDERRLVTQGIFGLEKVESDGECRDIWDPEVQSARWPEEVFAESARVLDGVLRELLEARAYEKPENIEEEADIVEGAWSSPDDTLTQDLDVHWNRLPSSPQLLSPVDNTTLAKIEDDSPQSTPKCVVSIPRVEFRIESQPFSGPWKGDDSAVPTIWLCLGTRHIADQCSKGEEPAHGYKVIKPISVQEKLMLVDAVMLLGAGAISKRPELCLIRENHHCCGS